MMVVIIILIRCVPKPTKEHVHCYAIFSNFHYAHGDVRNEEEINNCTKNGLNTRFDIS